MKEKVLIAEDDFSNGLSALAAMDELGYEAVVANNAEDAIEIIKKEDFLGVLTDMNMPLKQNDSVDPRAGELVTMECIKRAVPVAVVTGGGVGHHGVPCIKVLIPNSMVMFSSEQKISLEHAGEIDSNDKDVIAWKHAWKILSERTQPEVIISARKRYRKYIGIGFEGFK